MDTWYSNVTLPVQGSAAGTSEDIEAGAIRVGGRTFQGRAFGIPFLTTENAIRRKAIDVVTNKRFDQVILGVILLNTIVIAIDDPLAAEDTPLKQTTNVIDLVFMCIFAAEMLVKMLAMGIVYYLKDPWNVVDFVIVMSGAASLFFHGSAIFSLLRIVKVFRPLRSINRVPGMRRLVNTLFSCLPLMFDVVCLSLLVFYLFSLVGVVMWNESLHHRCWMADDSNATPGHASLLYPSNTSYWGRVCSESSQISAFESSCPMGTPCLPGAPAPYRFANFDHLGAAMLLVFQCVTLDGWITHSYAVEDGWSPVAAVFFVFLTMFGAYFVANLVLAVVTDALSKYTSDENLQNKPLTEEGLTKLNDGETENKEEDDVESPHSATQVLAETPALPLTPRRSSKSMFNRNQVRGTQRFAQEEWKHFVSGIQTQALKGIHQLEKEHQRKRAYTMETSLRGDDDKLAMTVPTQRREASASFASTLAPQAGGTLRLLDRSDTMHARTTHDMDSRGQGGGLDTARCSMDVPWQEVRSELDRRFMKMAAKRSAVVGGLIASVIMCFPKHNKNMLVPVLKKPRGRTQTNSTVSYKKNDPLDCTAASDGSKMRGLSSPLMRGVNARNNLVGYSAMSQNGSIADPYNLDSESQVDYSGTGYRRIGSGNSVASATTTVFSFASRSETVGKYTQSSSDGTWWRIFCCCSERWRHDLRQLCRSPYFNHFITGVILVNALMMGIEHYDMPAKLEAVLDVCNIIITFTFLAETLLKLFAYGPARWAKDTFNLFDALVVIISLIELGFWESKAVSLFRVFRMFRVLRFLKLARSWKVLHKIVQMIQSSLEYIGYLVLLIFLFIFIFAVLGRSLFAGKLSHPQWCTDSGFDDCVATEKCQWEFSQNVIPLLYAPFVEMYDLALRVEIDNGVPDVSQLGTAALTHTSVLKTHSLVTIVADMLVFNKHLSLDLFSTILEANRTSVVRILRTVFREGAFLQMVVPAALLSSMAQEGILTARVPLNYTFLTPDDAVVDDGSFTGNSYFVEDYIEAAYLLREYVANTSNLTGAGLGRCREGNGWGLQDNIPRASFNTLPWAAIHVFQALTRDSWALLCFRVMGEVSPFAVMYFLIILVFGTYLLFSMFIAILLVKLSEQSSQRDKKKKEKRERIQDEKRRKSMVLLQEIPVSGRSGTPTSPAEVLGDTSADRTTLGNGTSTAPTSKQEHPLIPPTSPKSPLTSPSPASRAMSPVTRTDVLLFQMGKQKERKERLDQRKKMKYEERLRLKEKEDGGAGGNRPREPSVVSLAGKTSSFYANSFKEFKMKLTTDPVAPKESAEAQESDESTGQDSTSGSQCNSFSSTTHVLGETGRNTPTYPRSAMKGSRLKDTARSEDNATLCQTKSAMIKDEADVADEQSAQLDAIDFFLEEVGVDKCYAESAEDSEDEWEELEGKSFFIFSSTSPVRLWLTDLLVTGSFERVVSYLIILNCGLLTLNDQTLGNNRDAILVVRIIDWCFTVVFTLEILCRCIVYNCVMDSWSYLRRNQGWNKVDFVIVILSLAAIPVEAQGMYYGQTSGHHEVVGTLARMVKAVRAFRPLRILVRTKRMKVVVGAFVNTIPAVFNVMAVAFVLFFIFGVAGVQLMQGAFRRCSDGSDRSRFECTGMWNATAVDGVYMSEADMLLGYRTLSREWVNPRDVSFDNLLASWLTLLEVAALSGWTDVMYAAIDSGSLIDDGPVRDNRPVLAVYFVAWIFAGAFFVMNIFTGIVVDHFTRQKLELDGSIWLTDKQEEDLRVKRIIVNSKAKKRRALPMHPNQFNQFCYSVVTYKYFPKFILICVLLNVALMATVHHDMNETFENIQSYGNTVFTIIFTLEMVLELGVAGPRHYLNFKWLRLDGLIVLFSWIEILISVLFTGGTATAVIQILRLGRAFRVLRHFKGLRKLLMTLYYSIPAFYNISSLLVLMFFIFSVLGMALFEDVRITDSEEIYPVLLSRKANFQTFPNAMLTLYRVATMDSWWRIVAGCQVEEPFCSDDVGNCGNAISSSLYFSTFMLCVGFVMMNLFIAIILENFRESVLLPEDLMRKMDVIVLFRELWAKYDPKGVQYIEASQFIPLLQHLKPPFGLFERPRTDILPTIQQLDFPITWPEQRVLFADAVDAIGEVVFDIKLVDSIATRKYLKMRYDMDVYQGGYTMAHWYAACVIQAAWRSYAIGAPVSGEYIFKAPNEMDLMKTIAAAVKKERDETERRKNGPVQRNGPGPSVPMLNLGGVSRLEGTVQQQQDPQVFPTRTRGATSTKGILGSLPSFGSSNATPITQHVEPEVRPTKEASIRIDPSGVFIRSKHHEKSAMGDKLLQKYFDKHKMHQTVGTPPQVPSSGAHHEAGHSEVKGLAQSNVFSPTIPLSSRRHKAAGATTTSGFDKLSIPLLGSPSAHPTLARHDSTGDPPRGSARQSPRDALRRPSAASWGSSSVTSPTSSQRTGSYCNDFSQTRDELAMLKHEVNRHLRHRGDTLLPDTTAARSFKKRRPTDLKLRPLREPAFLPPAADDTPLRRCDSSDGSSIYPYSEGALIRWGTSAPTVGAVVVHGIAACAAVMAVLRASGRALPGEMACSPSGSQMDLMDDMGAGGPASARRPPYGSLTLHRMASNSSSSAPLPPKGSLLGSVPSRAPTPPNLAAGLHALSTSTGSGGMPPAGSPASQLSSAFPPNALLAGTPISSPRGSNPSVLGRPPVLHAVGAPPSPPHSFSNASAAGYLPPVLGAGVSGLASSGTHGTHGTHGGSGNTSSHPLLSSFSRHMSTAGSTAHPTSPLSLMWSPLLGAHNSPQQQHHHHLPPALGAQEAHQAHHPAHHQTHQPHATTAAADLYNSASIAAALKRGVGPPPGLAMKRPPPVPTLYPALGPPLAGLLGGNVGGGGVAGQTGSPSLGGVGLFPQAHAHPHQQHNRGGMTPPDTARSGYSQLL